MIFLYMVNLNLIRIHFLLLKISLSIEALGILKKICLKPIYKQKQLIILCLCANEIFLGDLLIYSTEINNYWLWDICYNNYILI